MNKLKLLILSCFFLLSWRITQEQNFLFQRGNQKITLELLNGLPFLKWDLKTKLKLNFENIDSEKLSFSAPGISILKYEKTKNVTYIEITPKKKIIRNDTLKLLVIGRDSKDSIWFHNFKIPIKK